MVRRSVTSSRSICICAYQRCSKQQWVEGVSGHDDVHTHRNTAKPENTDEFEQLNALRESSERTGGRGEQQWHVHIHLGQQPSRARRSEGCGRCEVQVSAEERRTGMRWSALSNVISTYADMTAIPRPSPYSESYATREGVGVGVSANTQMM